MVLSGGVSRTTSRATSRTRSRSRPRNSNDLHRLYSAQHMNDASVYHEDVDVEIGQEEEENLEREASQSTEETASDDEGDESKEHRDPEKKRRRGSRASEISDEVRMGVANERDIEAGPPLEKKQTTRDPNLVTWDGPDDPANPKNWKFATKWAATFVISSFTFISPVSSSMVAPAIPAISRDLGITNEVQQQLTISIFILAYAIGPLFLGPLSEIYGRVPVLQLSNAFYLAWNLGCGFAQSKGQLIAFRFLAGLGGSAPLAIGGGVLSDCWKAEERGKAISVYSLAPLLGPAVGPIAGAFIAETTTWRWCFWSTSIATALIQLSGLFFLRETYVPKIMKAKANRLRKETGNQALHTEWESPDRTLWALLRVSLVRPFRLLLTQPIVQVLALYMAYIYGLMYLVLSTFPTLWTNVYRESVGIGGLNYISMGVGFFLGIQVCAPLSDMIYRRLKKKNNNIGKPEFRVPLLIPGALFLPVGLFWYGWSAQAQVHWIMPNIGVALFCAGCIIGFQCIQTYIVDAYTRYAASAVAAATTLRSLAGFGFPLFAPYMYNTLGYGWGNSLLGFLAIGVGIPAPFLLWIYGERLRAKSKFAAGG